MVELLSCFTLFLLRVEIRRLSHILPERKKERELFLKFIDGSEVAGEWFTFITPVFNLCGFEM